MVLSASRYNHSFALHSTLKTHLLHK